MNISCSAKPCPILLNAVCVIYEGANLVYTGINTNDNLQTALEKIDARFSMYMSTVNVIAPLQKTGTVNIVLSIPKATGSVDGYLASTDWTIFNNKQNAITLTTIGSSGVATFNGLSGALNIPDYSGAFSGFVPTSRQLTINGVAYDLSANRSWNVGTVTSIATTGPITGGTITSSGTIGITQSSALTDGYLSSTDWSIFNGKQNQLNGTGFVKASGTTISYDNSTYVPTSRTLTINGVAYDLSADRSWTIPPGTGTVTSIATSGPITGGPITTSGTIGITQSSASSDGYLSSTDWSTFNSKQNQLNGTGFVKASGTSITYDNSTYTPTSRNLTINGVTYNLSADRSWTIASGIAIGDIITSATPGSVLFAGALGALAQDNTNFFWDDANNRLGIGTATPTAPLDFGSATGSAGSISKIALYASVYGNYGFGVSPNQLDYVSANSHVFYNNSPSLVELLRIDSSGNITSLSLVGTGTRMVVASSTGVLSTQTMPAGTGTVTSIATTGPITGGTITTTGTIGITQATTSTDGYLSSTDWNTFNGKQPQLNGTGFVKASGTTISYDNSTYYLASNPSGFLNYNIYTSDGTLSADRTVTGNGKNIKFDGVNGLHVDSNPHTNEVALFESVEPNIHVKVIAGALTNSASVFLSPSAGFYGAIHNRTGGGLEFYTGATPSVAITIGANLNLGIGGAPNAINSLEVSRADQWSGAFIGNMNGARTPSATYGIHLGWNYTGGSGESNIVWGNNPGGVSPLPYLVFSTWNGTTKTDRVEFQDTGKVVFKQYTSPTAITGGPVVGHLAFDSNGNIITVTPPTGSGTVTSVATTGPITGGTFTTSGTIGITQSTTSTDGYLSSTDWNTFNNKVPTARTLTINGVGQDLSADRSWTVTATTVNIYNSDGTLTADRTVGASASNWILTFEPRVWVLTSNVADAGLGTQAMLVVNSADYATTFSSGANIYTAIDNTFYQTFTDDATFSDNAVNSGLYSSTNIQPYLANSTITMTQGNGVRALSAGSFQNKYSGEFDSTITHLAGVHILTDRNSPGKFGSGVLSVTNMYGLLINDINELEDFNITNRWGIYQEGSLDTNYFAGKTIIGPSNATGGATSFKVTGLPTSSAGLSTGDVWNDSGVLTVV